MHKLIPIVCLAAASACNVFDDKLESQILPAMAESCGGDLMAVMGDQQYTLDGNSNSFNPTQCGIGADWTGADGFVKFTIDEAPMRMHFAARGLDNQDIALYVLSDCAENRTCDRAHDECGAGGPEHMTYEITQPGDYWVGVDTKEGEAGRVELTVMDPECGNGMIDHAEGCDGTVFPDSYTPGAGVTCNENCQLVFSADQQPENEPNDDIIEAHVLMMGSGERIIRGKIGGVCDVDRFQLEGVSQGDVVRAKIYDGSGSSCTPAQMPVPTKVSVLGGPTPTTVIRDTAGMCPVVETTPLSTDGDYYVMVASSSTTPEQYDYTLVVEINPP